MIRYIIIIICLLINLCWSSEINAFVDSSHNLILSTGKKQIAFYRDRNWILNKGFVYGLVLKKNEIFIESYNLTNKNRNMWDCKLKAFDGFELLDADFNNKTLLILIYNYKKKIETFTAYKISLFGDKIKTQEMYRDQNYFRGFIIKESVVIREYFDHVLRVNDNASKIDTIYNPKLDELLSIKKVNDKILIIAGKESCIFNPINYTSNNLTINFELCLLEKENLYSTGNIIYILRPIYTKDSEVVLKTQLLRFNIKENLYKSVLSIPGEIVFYSIDKNHLLNIYSEVYKKFGRHKKKKLKSFYYIYNINDNFKLLTKKNIDSNTLFKLY